MLSSSPDTAIGFYSFLRYVADPSREEVVNVGLFLVSRDGEWARFRPYATKRRIEAIGRSSDVQVIRDWAETLRDAYGLEGASGLFPQDAVNAETLHEWARESGGMLRLSEPRVAVDADMETLWTSLWRRYIRRGRGLDLVPRQVRDLTGAEERVQLVDAFVSAAGSSPNFDPERVRRWRPFEGTRSTHVADIAISNGAVTAIAQAIPFVHGTEIEVIERRSILLDAALDLPGSVLRFGIYDDPPVDRLSLLESTTSFLDGLQAEHRIQLYPRREFDSLIERVAPRLFPTNHRSSTIP